MVDEQAQDSAKLPLFTRLWLTPVRMARVIFLLFPIYLGYAWLMIRRRLGVPASAERWERTHQRSAARFVRVAQDMKGGLIKLGQIISTRVDLVPATWIEQLTPLQDKVEPADWSVVEKHLEREFGETPEDRFETIEKRACAAASFGQVHRATTKDGRSVALKVRYPDIKLKLACDLSALRLAVPFFNLFVPKVPLGAIYGEIGRALEAELDYRSEARFGRIIRKNLAEMAGVSIPEVIDEHSTDSVLCTEFFEGLKVTDAEGLKAAGIETHDVIRQVMHAYTHMFFADGVFQSDPHPGNLLVRREDEGPLVCILDFGQCKELPRGFHAQLVRCAMAFMVRDVDGFSRSIIELGMLNEEDTVAARPLLEEFFGEMFEMSPEELKALDVSGLKEKLKVFTKRIDGLVIPQDIVLYGRAFSLLAGVVTQLDSSVNGFVLARPLIMETLMKSGAFAQPAPAPSKPQAVAVG
ncbi:MAG: AarF/UbiB family protein [Myxococcota bacterium]